METFKATIGYDVEFPVRDKVTKEYISAIPFIAGTKKNPLKTKHGFIHHDNVLAEIGGNPAVTEEAFVNSVTKAMMDLQVYLHDKGLEPVRESFIEYETSELATPEAMQFGCEAEYCVYNEDVFAPFTQDPALLGNGRTAAGHIHMSLARMDPDSVHATVKLCDALLGLYSVSRNPDGHKRRVFYGKAGTFRVKPYGMEYRVPDNFWTASKNHMRDIFKLAKTVQEFNRKGPRNWVAQLKSEVSLQTIHNMINNSTGWTAEQVDEYLTNRVLRDGLGTKVPLSVQVA